MNPINQALQDGYSEDEVLSFVSNAYPHLRNKLAKAVGTGYSVKEIIKFLSNAIGGSSVKPKISGSQQNIHAEQMRADEKKKEQLLKSGLSLIGGAALGKAALQNLPKLAGAVRGLPKTPGSAPGITPPAIPALEKALTGSRLKDLTKDLFDMRLAPKIEQLASKNPVDVIPGMLQKQLTEEQKSYLSQKFGKEPEELIKDYATSYLEKSQKSPLSREGVSQQFESGQQDAQLKTQMPLEETQSQKMAMLPDGQVGQITEERQGIGTIELPDGKVHRRKLDEIIEEPEEAAEIALELIKSFTPEQQRSTHHAISFYDPVTKEGYFLFHNGTAYKVEDISAEEYGEISQEVIAAKTTGQTPYGMYAVGEGGRGAGYNKHVKEGKKPYRKLEVGYNIFSEFQRLINEGQKKRKKRAK